MQFSRLILVLHRMKSFLLFRTVSEPDVPTLRDVTNVQQTSAMLDWNLGDTVTINSTVVFYIDTSSTSSEQRTTTISRLTGLTPGRTYRFYLVVTSFDKTAQSLNGTFITRKFIISSSSLYVNNVHRVSKNVLSNSCNDFIKC